MKFNKLLQMQQEFEPKYEKNGEISKSILEDERRNRNLMKGKTNQI